MHNTWSRVVLLAWSQFKVEAELSWSRAGLGIRNVQSWTQLADAAHRIVKNSYTRGMSQTKCCQSLPYAVFLSFRASLTDFYIMVKFHRFSSLLIPK